CERVAEGINKILSDIDVYDEDEDEEQEQVRSIRPCIIIENSAHHQTDKSGSIGSTFEDIAAIINSVDEKYKQPLSWRKKHKTRKAKKGEIEKDLEYPPRNIHDPIDPYGSAVGVCLDLAHLFGAGIDIRTESAWQQTLNDFDRIIGRRYLLAVHLNDSLGEFNSGKDLHAVPGKGLIGIESFRFVMNCSWFDDIPIIVETKEIGVKIIRWLEQLEKDPQESITQEKV
ncbi:MAG: putative endonuclease 4, partial [Streblomastix strix]